MLEMLIPIVAILVTFAFPVALVFTFKWFKLKEKELQLEAEMRRTAGQALESRVQRLESVILALDADLRAKLNAGAPSRSDLFEPPATQESSQPGPLLEAPIKSR
jgi:type II secretory pathway pseudopilin PulG